MILRFENEYRWLSNFWLAPVELDGLVYDTVEHAYQAAKTLYGTERQDIRMATTPGRAKRAGSWVTLRQDWEAVKLDTMLGLLRQKFGSGELREKLLATGQERIIEGNNWGDTFWGVCRGRGQNYLGRLIMQVREELRG